MRKDCSCGGEQTFRIRHTAFAALVYGINFAQEEPRRAMEQIGSTIRQSLLVCRNFGEQR